MSGASLIIRADAWCPDSVEAKARAVSFETVRSNFVDAAVERTDEYDIPQYTPISNQLQAGTCTVNAWCDALEILLGLELLAEKKDPTPEQLSRLHLYWISRCYEGTQKVDKGTSIATAGEQLKTIGVCPERLWPYDLTKLFTSPPLETFNVASDNMIVGLYSIDSTGKQRADDVEAAIRANHPVPFGTFIGADYQAYQGADVVFDPPVGGDPHAQLIVGVRRRSDGLREFKVRNSWSDQWGSAGHAWISERYLTWENTHNLWVGTRMKELVL